MEPITYVVIALALVVCAYMAWNIGANDVANAMGTSVGSRALTLKQAVIIAAIFEFAGAFFAGDAVTETVRKGILEIPFGDDGTVSKEISQDIAFGFIAAMMAAAVWLTIATRFGLPVSTTHSIIGGIVGVGLVLEVDHDADYINWEKLGEVVLSWIASPLMGAILAFFSYWIIKKTILDAKNPEERSLWLAPILAFPTFFVLGIALQFKALKGFFARAEKNGWIKDKYDWLPYKPKDGITGSWNPTSDVAWLPTYSLILAAVIGAIASLGLYFVLRRTDINQEVKGFRGVERIFIWLQIITAAYVAFAHGANDRSNAIGPMAAVWQVLSDGGTLASEAPIPLWLILLGSAGIAVGVLTWGWRVMETIGKKITDITPTRGFAAEFGAATTILIFSMPFLAVPVSTTHTLVGAVVGVGLAGGAKAVDFRVFGKIAASWVASVPVAAFGAATIYVASGGDNLNMIIILPIAFLAVGYAMWRTRGQGIHVEDALSDVGGSKADGPTPFDLFHKHAEAVEVTVEKMVAAVKKACAGEDASQEIEETVEAEHSADKIKSEIRELASQDLRFGIAADSDSFLHMVSRQDRIADYAQNVAEQLSFRPLMDDETARENLVEMAEVVSKTVATYEDLIEALRQYHISGRTKAGVDEVYALIREVNLVEHEADGVEAKAAEYVFSNGDDTPLAAMHMYRVLQRLDDVANAAEKAANALLPLLRR